MKENKYTEEEARLLAHRSLGETLGPVEQQQLAEALVQHPGLNDELASLREMRQLFAQLHPVAEPDFTQRVVQAVSTIPIWYRPLLRNWSTVAAAACIVLGLGLSFVYYNSGTLETEALLGLEEIQLEDAYAFE